MIYSRTSTTCKSRRPRAKQEALDKYGRYRLGAMRDAHQELYEDHRREGLPMPDYQRIGRESIGVVVDARLAQQ